MQPQVTRVNPAAATLISSKHASSKHVVRLGITRARALPPFSAYLSPESPGPSPLSFDSRCTVRNSNVLAEIYRYE
jgi:hypothetical protein